MLCIHECLIKIDCQRGIQSPLRTHLHFGFTLLVIINSHISIHKIKAVAVAVVEVVLFDVSLVLFCKVGSMIEIA